MDEFIPSRARTMVLFHTIFRPVEVNEGVSQPGIFGIGQAGIQGRYLLVRQKLSTTCAANIAWDIQPNKDGIAIIEAVDQIVRRRIESYFIGYIRRPRRYIRGGLQIAFPPGCAAIDFVIVIASNQKRLIEQVLGFQYANNLVHIG